MGLLAQTSCIASGCPALMGCSMLCASNRANSLRWRRASSALQAPLASRRMVRWNAFLSLRTFSSNRHSESVSMAPTLNFRQVNPWAILTCASSHMASMVFIQTRPLNGMLSFPSVNGPGNNMPLPPFCKSRNALSRANCREGNSSVSLNHSEIGWFSAAKYCSWVSTSSSWACPSMLKSGNGAASPQPVMPLCERSTKKWSFWVYSPRLVLAGLINCRVCFSQCSCMFV